MKRFTIKASFVALAVATSCAPRLDAQKSERPISPRA
jgi:hypothetical protein